MDRIDALRLFVRLAERKSFTAAARDLRIKQSTASKWVAALEQEAGIALVERTTRSVRLSDAGRRFVVGASSVLAAYDALGEELANDQPELGGRLRANLPVVLGRRHVVPPIIEFLRQHPRVELELGFSDRYVNLVEEGLDLAIRVGVPADTSARGHKLADGRRVLVAAPAYVKARGAPRRPRDLVTHECLVHGDPTGPAIWRFGKAGRPLAPVTVRGRVSASNSEAVLAMALAGMGVALLADWLVADEVARGRLVELLADHDTPPVPIYALTPPGRYTPPAVRALVEHLAGALGGLGAPQGRARAR